MLKGHTSPLRALLCSFTLGFFLPLLTAVRKTATACAGRGQGISSLPEGFTEPREICEGS